MKWWGGIGGGFEGTSGQAPSFFIVVWPVFYADALAVERRVIQPGNFKGNIEHMCDQVMEKQSFGLNQKLN